MSEEWRIQPATPAKMAVVVDGWVELPLQPASPSNDRVDLITERISDEGERTYLVVSGAVSMPFPPPIPIGHTHIGTVRVHRGQVAVLHCHIGG